VGIRVRNVTGVQTCALPICLTAFLKLSLTQGDKSYRASVSLHPVICIDSRDAEATLAQVFGWMFAHRIYFYSCSTSFTRTLPVNSSCINPFFCSFSCSTSCLSNSISRSAVERILAIRRCSGSGGNFNFILLKFEYFKFRVSLTRP